MPSRPKQFRPFGPPKHQRTSSKAERDAFYTSAAWKRCRLAFLSEHPLCDDCLKLGRVVEATIPHHIIERLDRPDLAFDHKNLLALCSPCHTRRHKTGAATPGAGQFL